MKAQFKIENIGKTEAKNVSMKIDFKNPTTGEWQPAFQPQEKINIGGSESFTAPVTLPFGMKANLADELDFNVTLEYEDVNSQLHKKFRAFRWERRNNMFAVLKLEEN